MKMIGYSKLNKIYFKAIQFYSFLQFIQPKCEMYYPNTDEENDESTLEFGKYRLNYLSERIFEDFAIRSIECINMEVNK